MEIPYFVIYWTLVHTMAILHIYLCYAFSWAVQTRLSQSVLLHFTHVFARD
jgi:hypothetical protein